MDYQVWTKAEYGEEWTRVVCGDLVAAKREIDKAVRAGGEPMLTVEVPYELNIKVSEVGSEVKKSETKRDRDTRIKGEGEVRRGDAETTGEVDKGVGDTGAADSVPGK